MELIFFWLNNEGIKKKNDIIAFKIESKIC